MELYSPKVQKADNFRKNTLKKNDDILMNRKENYTGSTIIFELKEEKKKKAKPVVHRKNFFLSIGDLMKLRFYERMKIFFESETKDEYSNKITFADKH